MSNHSDCAQQAADLEEPAPDSARRRFLSRGLQMGALGALAGWAPAFQVAAASANAASGAAPRDFPANVPLFKQAFRNWSGEIKIDDAWTCSPRDENEVVQVVNWAWKNTYTVRVRGQAHNWSPLIFQPGQKDVATVILMDLGSHLNSVRCDTSTSPAQVTAGTGILLQDLLQQMEQAGLGFTATPAPGDLTLGGILAIGGHGTAVPAIGEVRQPGQTYGSISNNVLSLTAVVWDRASNGYRLKTFHRADAQCGAFLVHLGRALITQVTLQAGSNSRLRCVSYTNISARELFAPPGTSKRTFASFLDQAGRVESIWFPFTDYPWLKVWSVTANEPPKNAKRVDNPFNYSFSDNIPKLISDLLAQINISHPEWTPTLGMAQLEAVKIGLAWTQTQDIWGWSKNSLLYIKPTTLRVTANGYAVLTSRAQVQQVISEFVAKYQALIATYREQGLYPINGPVEIRVTGLDQPAEAAVDGASTPLLSTLRPRPDHPEWDTAVWFDVLNVPGTPHANDFYRAIEAWLFARFNGDTAQVRVEWSKGWAYGDAGAWSDATMLASTIPNSLRAGQPEPANWDAACAILNQYDPARLFSSTLQQQLMR